MNERSGGARALVPRDLHGVSEGPPRRGSGHSPEARCHRRGRGPSARPVLKKSGGSPPWCSPHSAQQHRKKTSLFSVRPSPT